MTSSTNPDPRDDATADPSGARRPYARPELRSYGPLRRLTRGGSGRFGEANTPVNNPNYPGRSFP